MSPIYAGQTQVTFNASASRDDDGTVSAYRWDFGDGSAAEGASPTISHVYPVVGRCLEVTYTVLLTIVDDKSGRGSANQTIKVIQLPVPGSAECPR